MKTNYVLIDYENVQVSSLDLLSDQHFQVRIFLGPNNTRLDTSLVLAVKKLGERAEYVTLLTAGPNALDFHIAYYLGVLASEDSSGFFHVISKDKGFDPLIQYLSEKGIQVARSVSIEEMPCFVAKKQTVGPPHKPTDDDFLNDVIVFLIRQKTARPRTTKTLVNTIRVRYGRDIANARIESVYQGLVSRGYVKAEGTKITYNLPSEPKPVKQVQK